MLLLVFCGRLATESPYSQSALAQALRWGLSIEGRSLGLGAVVLVFCYDFGIDGVSE